MVAVTPPPFARLPQELQRKQPELAKYLEQINRILLQLWTRTGGSEDLVDFSAEGEDNNNQIAYLNGQINAIREALESIQCDNRVVDLKPLEQRLKALESDISPLYIPEPVVASSSSSVYGFNRITGTGTQAVTSALTAVTWNASSDSSGSDVTYSGGSPTRLTVASDGVYRVGGYVTIQSGDQRPQAALELLINGVATGNQRSGAYIRNSGISYDYWTLEMAGTPISLSASDYIELGVGQVSAGTYGYAGTATVTAQRANSEFWIERVA